MREEEEEKSWSTLTVNGRLESRIVEPRRTETSSHLPRFSLIQWI